MSLKKSAAGFPLTTNNCVVSPGDASRPREQVCGDEPPARPDSGGAPDACGTKVTALIKDHAGRGSVSCIGIVELGHQANEYTGSTLVVTGALLRASFIANGGSPSSIGASSPAARNLIISGTLEYRGSSRIETDRLFTINSSAGAIVSNESPETGAALIFTNAGMLAFGSANLPRTLTLSGSNAGPNGLYPALDDNGIGATTLHKRGAGTWDLRGRNFHTGGTTVHEGVLIATDPASLGRGPVLVYDRGTLVIGVPTSTGPGLLVINGVLKLDSRRARIRLPEDSFYIFNGTLDLNGLFDTAPAGDYAIIEGGAGAGRHADNLRSIAGYKRRGYSVTFSQGVLIVVRENGAQGK